MPLNPDTDRTQAVRLKHLSPSWVKALDEEIGKRGLYFDLTAIFRGMCRPITRITEELRVSQKLRE